MGILSNLITQKNEIDTNRKLAAIKGLQAALTAEGATPETKEWAIQGIAQLADDTFGGTKGAGGGGKTGSSASGASGSKGAAVGQFFKSILQGAISPYVGSAGVKQEIKDIGARRPQGAMLQTPEQIETTRAKLAAKKAQEDADRQYGIETAKNRADTESLKTSAEGVRAVRGKDLDEAGVDRNSPEGRLYLLTGKYDAQPKMDATERQEWIDAQGQPHTTYRDPHTGIVYDEDTREPINLTAKKLKDGWKAAQKETQDVTPMRSHEERLRIEHPDWSPDKVKLEAAKAVDADEATKAKQAEQRINIQLTNAAATNTPAAPGTMQILAKQWVDSGGTISIPLNYRGKDKRDFDDAVAAEIRSRQAQGENTSLIENRFNANALKGLIKTEADIKAGAQATNNEIDRAKFLARKVPLSSFRKFNSLRQLIDSNVTDDPDLAAFREALVAARSRYNSMITSMRSGGGAATNQVRTETVDEVLNRTMAPEAMQRALDEMKTGIGNVLGGYGQVVKEYRDRVSSGDRQQQQTPPPGASGVNPSVQSILQKHGLH